MKCEYENKDKLLKIEITEEIDHHTTQNLRRKIDNEIQKYMPQTVVFDFNSVSFMDSAGIGMLIGRYKLTRMLGGKLEFISKSNNEAFARISVAAFASQLDPTIEELADIKTAVSEAVTNCIIHAYEDFEGIIQIQAKLFANSIVIEISDNGNGIENVEVAKEPLYTSKPDLERSGMGFTIMENFMDEVKVESILGVGTKITMKKVIKQKDKDENSSETEQETSIFGTFRI